MNSNKAEANTAAHQQLFGADSFLAFTLAHATETNVARTAVLSDGTSVELWENGILTFEPAQRTSDQQNILISCGVHGNETAPMELVDRLVIDILAQTITVRNRLMFVIGNPLAATRQLRFCDENLNRLFMGRHSSADVCQSLEGQRARRLEHRTRQFFSNATGRHLHYDLHTAIRGSKHEKFAVYPLLHERTWSRTQLGFLQACGIQAVLLSNQASTTYSYYTSTEFNAHAFTVELGSVKPFGKNDLGKFADIERELGRLIEGVVSFDSVPDSLRIYSVIAEVNKRSEALQFSFEDDVENFTEFAVGTVLASDGKYNYRVQREGERIVFPHKDVPVGHRALLVVAPHTL